MLIGEDDTWDMHDGFSTDYPRDEDENAYTRPGDVEEDAAPDAPTTPSAPRPASLDSFTDADEDFVDAFNEAMRHLHAELVCRDAAAPWPSWPEDDRADAIADALNQTWVEGITGPEWAAAALDYLGYTDDAD